MSVSCPNYIAGFMQWQGKFICRINATVFLRIFYKTDPYNYPEAFNRSVKGLAQAWRGLEVMFSEETTFFKALHILEDWGVRMYWFCLMD